MIITVYIDSPQRKSNNIIYEHRFLTDQQYRFCSFYAFGLAYNILSYGVEMFEMYNEELFQSIVNQATPEYRNKENLLKYAFDNAAGSYKAAYLSKNYNTAKTNGIRLLKNPYIQLELYFMFEWIYKNNTGRTSGHSLYTSPLSNWNQEKEIRLQGFIKRNGNKVLINTH